MPTGGSSLSNEGILYDGSEERRAGYTIEGGIERLYRYLRMFRIVEGTSEIQRRKIARAMLKE